MRKLPTIARPTKNREVGKRGIEETFVKRCKSRALKFLCFKFKTPAIKGAPDRIVFKGLDEAIVTHIIMHGGNNEAAERYIRWMLDSIIEFVELKAEGKKPEPHQARFHDKLRAFGFKVTVIDNKIDAKAYDGS